MFCNMLHDLCNYHTGRTSRQDIGPSNASARCTPHGICRSGRQDIGLSKSAAKCISAGTSHSAGRTVGESDKSGSQDIGPSCGIPLSNGRLITRLRYRMRPDLQPPAGGAGNAPVTTAAPSDGALGGAGAPAFGGAGGCENIGPRAPIGQEARPRPGHRPLHTCTRLRPGHRPLPLCIAVGRGSSQHKSVL